MNQQVEKILELLAIVCEKKGKCIEVLEEFIELCKYTKDEKVKELLLKTFYYPSGDILQENYRNNLAVLYDSNKCFGYGFVKEKLKSKILFLKSGGGEIFYFYNDEIRHQYLLDCTATGEEGTIYINVLPEDLPQFNRYPFILCYNKEIFECCMQIASFGELVKRSKAILVGDGLEEYIEKVGALGYKKWVGYGVQQWAKREDTAYERFLYPEKRISFGTLYSEHIFYIVRVGITTSSLGALMLMVLKQLKLADEKGYIPVIDFSCFPNVFLADDEVGIINPWEYYFEQPTQFGLSAVYHAKNVILGNAKSQVVQLDDIIDNCNVLEEYTRLFGKYIHMSKRVEKKSLAIYENLIEPDWRMLGIVYRGTDYRNRIVIGEHRQPSICDLIAKSKELMGKWNCDHIFLATEDKGAVETFYQEFGERMVCVEKERYESSVEYTQTHKFNREFDEYLKAEEYLTEMFILSKCNCLVSGRCGILAVVLPMNAGNYEETFIYDLGLYTADDYQ